MKRRKKKEVRKERMKEWKEKEKNEKKEKKEIFLPSLLKSLLFITFLLLFITIN
jgi:hypothetical protein